MQVSKSGLSDDQQLSSLLSNAMVSLIHKSLDTMLELYALVCPGGPSLLSNDTLCMVCPRVCKCVVIHAHMEVRRNKKADGKA